MGREFESLQARFLQMLGRAARPTIGMVGIVQSVERQIVVLDVTGSSPVTHPTFYILGCSQVGKAPDFDSGIS